MRSPAGRGFAVPPADGLRLAIERERLRAPGVLNDRNRRVPVAVGQPGRRRRRHAPRGNGLEPLQQCDPACEPFRGHIPRQPEPLNLEPGTAGRRREQRQEAAGRVLGGERYAVTSRSVRRRVKESCWPWLFDRLIERAADRHVSPEAHGLLVLL